MKLMKKFLSLTLVSALAITTVGCGSKTTDTKTESATSTEATKDTATTDTKADATTAETTTGGKTLADGVPTFDSINLGEDYTDVSASIKVLTHRTDLVDTTFKDYIAQFNEMYPNIKIEYESSTDYINTVTTKLTTKDWGDICMIPTTVDKDELPNLFVSFGDKATLEKSYVMLNNFTYVEKVYGIPSVGNAQGIVYNKKVFEEAGITTLPKTPDEFIADLQLIKDKTDAIPMYTNFAAGWTMTAWDAYIGGSATGDPDFMNNGLVHGSNPFSKQADMTGPYAVYSCLYEAAKKGLIEDDPTTTDWEGSKGMMNNGEIGVMVLGSWAVVQMQQAGDNGADIGYMPFPITVNGKQYASAGPDYNFGINVNSSDENKIASMLYVKWLTDKSNFAFDQGGVPIQVGAKYPEVLSAFDGIELVIDNPAVTGEETYFNDLNSESELGLNSDPTHVSSVLEAALDGSMTLDDIMNDWNSKWAAAQEKENITVNK
jgi:ABC-type glycerol-3-phosphate transport system substrate-binding protein